MGLDMGQLTSQDVKSISHRLSSSADLALPGQLTKSGEQPTVEKRQQYLEALLLRDPGVFLERHGEMLTPKEREAFQPLRGDYEVDFYLKLLEDQGDTHKHDTTVKNRRLAYMNRLLQEGTYFSDEAMKGRQPWLHHQYIGQYTPPSEAAPSAAAAAASAQQGPAQRLEHGGGGGGGGGRDGEGGGGGGAMPLTRSLLRHQDELESMLAQHAEQARYDMEEEETDSEEEEEEEQQQQQRAGGRGGGRGGGGGGGGGGGAAGSRGQAGTEKGKEWWQPGSREAAGGRPSGASKEGEEEEEEEEPGYVQVSQAEREENADAFLDLMKEKFLRGEDGGIDYRAIDADAALDDDWMETAGRDAEEKWFDED